MRLEEFTIYTDYICIFRAQHRVDINRKILVFNVDEIVEIANTAKINLKDVNER